MDKTKNIRVWINGNSNHADFRNCYYHVEAVGRDTLLVVQVGQDPTYATFKQWDYVEVRP
jgi:hypothetical protein